MDDSKILQIIPAQDWVAVFDDSGELLEPIVCFALVETTKDGETLREVRPMLPDGKLISFGDDASNYMGVKHALHHHPPEA
jgi:hypothetical protein